MKKNLILFTIGLLVLLSGFGSLVGIVRSRASNLVSSPVVAAQAPTVATPTVPNRIEGTPVRLQIPSLDMDLDITPGYYDAKTGQWTLTTNKVQYATTTPLPNNQEGNTFLYGHYRKNVFASLHKIKQDEVAIVTTDNGHTFYYQLNDVRVVDPTDSSSVFNYQGKPILTIQTCTGLFYEQRQLFTFNLQRVV